MERKNQKTYGRLLGMIYFGVIRSMLVVAAQSLATQETPKNVENTKTSVKYFRDALVFLSRIAIACTRRFNAPGRRLKVV
jgi:hypothetical protein